MGYSHWTQLFVSGKQWDQGNWQIDWIRDSLLLHPVGADCLILQQVPLSWLKISTNRYQDALVCLAVLLAHFLSVPMLGHQDLSWAEGGTLDKPAAIGYVSFIVGNTRPQKWHTLFSSALSRYCLMHSRSKIWRHFDCMASSAISLQILQIVVSPPSCMNRVPLVLLLRTRSGWQAICLIRVSLSLSLIVHLEWIERQRTG